jgi:hypothetical protein
MKSAPQPLGLPLSVPGILSHPPSFPLPHTPARKPSRFINLRTLSTLLHPRIARNLPGINAIRTLSKTTGVYTTPPRTQRSLRGSLIRWTPGDGLLVCPARFSRSLYPEPQPLLTTFRINTCESMSKQRTLTIFRMNTYAKPGGKGPPSNAPARLRTLDYEPFLKSGNWR